MRVCGTGAPGLQKQLKTGAQMEAFNENSNRRSRYLLDGCNPQLELLPAPSPLLIGPQSLLPQLAIHLMPYLLRKEHMLPNSHPSSFRVTLPSIFRVFLIPLSSSHSAQIPSSFSIALSQLMLVNLHTLPAELLRHVLVYADAVTLQAVRQTCQALRQAADDDVLWRAQVQRRFRVSSRALRSRRLLAAGGVSWRVLYAQWNSSLRMPMSRLSGNSYTAFARGRLKDEGALLWVTVVSTDDCRLVAGNLRLRVVVQNIAGGEPMQFHLRKASFQLTDSTTISLNDKGITCIPIQHLDQLTPQQRKSISRPNRAGRRQLQATSSHVAPPFRQQSISESTVSDTYSAWVFECLTARAEEGDARDAQINSPGKIESASLLGKDDFAVLTIDVMMPKAVFEVDALERLCALQIPVSWGSTRVMPLTAHFQDKVIWDNYKRLPGGWWVRAESSSACAM